MCLASFKDGHEHCLLEALKRRLLTVSDITCGLQFHKSLVIVVAVLEELVVVAKLVGAGDGCETGGSWWRW